LTSTNQKPEDNKKSLEFNRPLYYLTAPGIVLGAGGLVMGATFLNNYTNFSTGLQFGPTMLMILLIIVGTFMALTGILLHSMSTVLREAKTA
jgi:polyferredoxin